MKPLIKKAGIGILEVYLDFEIDEVACRKLYQFPHTPSCPKTHLDDVLQKISEEMELDHDLEDETLGFHGEEAICIKLTIELKDAPRIKHIYEAIYKALKAETEEHRNEPDPEEVG